MNKFIPLSVPNLKGNELKYVTTAVETEWVSTGGPYVEKFENMLAEYVHAEGGVSCQNGTAGLHLSLLLMNVTDRDEVIVPTLTFIAAVNPVRYIGASPVFMDCDDSLCMDPVKLADFCENKCDFIDGKLINKSTNKEIKALVVVHVFGNMADMEKLMPIAKKYNLKVIEDATEAIGTYYTDGIYAGKYAGTIGDIGVYSFNGNKIMTTGGGGMIVSDDKKLLDRAKFLSTQAKADTLYYVHDEIGYNYRMTNIQAALGIAQLEQLEDFIEIKIKNFEEYNKNIENIDGLRLIRVRKNTRSNHWFYGLFVEDDYKYNRDELIKYLSDNKIQSRPIWGLINNQKPYKDFETYKIDRANYYINHVVNIPCSSNLQDEDVNSVIEFLR